MTIINSAVFALLPKGLRSHARFQSAVSWLFVLCAACSFTPVDHLQNGRAPRKNGGSTPTGSGSAGGSGGSDTTAGKGQQGSSGGSDGEGNEAGAGDDVLRNALFVGGVASNDADDVIIQRLENEGYTVRLISGETSESLDPTTIALVVIARDIQLNDQLRSVAERALRNLSKPVVVWEPLLYPMLGMTDAEPMTNRGVVPNVTALDILDRTSPLAAGFSGTVSVLMGPRDADGRLLSFGQPNANAISVAAISGQREKLAIFAYEKGAAMPGLVAPARRVALFFSYQAPLISTQAGLALFDAAIRWADPP